MNPERQLQRKCRKLLRDLDIHPPLDVSQLGKRLGEHRGRPIRLLPRPLPQPGPFGIWLAQAGTDVVVYQQETTRPHQDHIIIHEFGHMIAGHESDENDDDLLRALFPDVDPDTVRHMLRRTHYDTAREREAETVATIILQWASVLDSAIPRQPGSIAGRNMQDALGDRMGWL